MKKLFKTALSVLGVAGLLGFGAASANALSFTVVIDKIEMVEDADNYPNTATTVYEPRSGIGETATKTVDLFDATQKLGTAYNLRKPDAGSYETILIHFSAINVVSGAATYNVLSDFTTANLFGTNGSLGVMILGDVGTGSDASDVSEAFGTGLSAMAPIQTVISGGGDITLPSLDLYLSSSDVVDESASSIGITTLPAVLPIVSQASDSASRANLLVDVDYETAFDGVSGFVYDASVVTVGLFTTDVPARPVAASTFTATTPTAVKQVEFIDPAVGTFYPLAWIDSDSDGLLDTGEYYTFFDTTRANNSVAVSGTSDISYTSILGGANARGVIGGAATATAIAFAGRTVSITIEMTNQATATAEASICAAAGDLATATGITADSAAATGVAGVAQCGAATDSSITVIYALNSAGSVSRSVTLDTRLGAGSGGDTNIDATEDLDFYLANTSQFDPISGFSYTEDDTIGGRVVITGVPAFDTDFAADLDGAAYDAAIAANWESGEVTSPETDTTTFSDAGGDVTIAVSGNTVVVDDSAPVDLGTFE